MLPVSANIVPAIPDFDPNLVDWECNVGTLPGGGTTAHGLSTTWTQDNTYLSTAEDDVFVRAQCGSNGEWVTIRTTIIEVNTLTVRDKHFPSNTVTVNSPSAGDLYLRDPGGGVTIEMQMTTTPTVSQSQWDNVCWKISGLAAAPSSGNFGGAVEAQLTPNPNRTFTVEVGFDKNGNGGLDANEVARTVNVCLITVSSMTVTDHATPSNTVTNPSGTSLVVAEDPTSGHALVDLSASWLPGAAGVGARVLWTVAGASPVPASGDFGAASYTTIQLTGSSGNRTATVSVGVDGNANGALDAGEISHSVIVGVAQVVLTVEDAGGAKGAVPLTECMVGRNVTFTATVTDNFPCGVTNPIWFTFHYEAPDGTPVTDDDWSTDRVEDNTRHMPDFVDSNGDHKYTTPVHVVADNDGVRGTSNTLSIDVYQLWIKHFKDYHTGKDWQVCVDNYALPSADQHWIDYDAYASSDCESWSWSMPDGFPDTWHLYVDGQFAKAGHNIYIPEGDLPYDSHWDYFGDSYGTVYVFCEDGEGNNHSFYSSSMSPSKKAEVFFDPTGTTHPGGTSKNWFYYWKYALFGSTGDINWNAGTFYMQCASNGVITVGESGNVNYATAFSHASYHGYARPTADGKSKIDLFYCFVTHELQHRADFPFFDVGTDTDGDHLPDTIDPFPAAVNGVAYPEYTGGTAWQGDWEQRARAVEGVAASADKDWSKGGKQW
ncbi:MAG: hypothetical protein U1E05_15525 [Patescibacteria group bacterium]|nr:hypothetical protein [Patescibacteria group bacterium]